MAIETVLILAVGVLVISYVPIVFVTVYLVFVNAKKPISDSTLNLAAVRRLIVGVLVAPMGLLVAMGYVEKDYFARVLDSRVILTSPITAQVKHVRVYATANIEDPTISTSACIALPPKKELEFIDGESTRWTSDNLDSLDAFVKQIPFRFPFKVGSANRLTTSDVQEAIDWLDSAKVAVTNHIHYSFPRGKQGDETQKRRITAIIDYIESVKSKLVARPEPQIIDISELRIKGSEVEGDAASAFWKRALGINVFGNRYGTENRRAFGPYFDVKGAETPANYLSYPLPTAPAASVIAYVGTFNSSGTFTRSGPPLAFYSIGNRIPNTSDKMLYMYLAINDERPGDNGDGYCEIYYRLVPLTKND